MYIISTDKKIVYFFIQQTLPTVTNIIYIGTRVK